MTESYLIIVRQGSRRSSWGTDRTGDSRTFWRWRGSFRIRSRFTDRWSFVPRERGWIFSGRSWIFREGCWFFRRRCWLFSRNISIFRGWCWIFSRRGYTFRRSGCLFFRKRGWIFTGRVWFFRGRSRYFRWWWSFCGLQRKCSEESILKSRRKPDCNGEDNNTNSDTNMCNHRDRNVKRVKYC